MRVLLLFLDGVGIGRNDLAENPLLAARLPALRSICDGELPVLRRRTIVGRMGAVVPLDAAMGMPGLPQSGTGQTALFAGINGPRLAGKHFGPHPTSTLRPHLQEKNIFRRLQQAGKHPCFANAFPQRFFDYAGKHPGLLTVTTLSCMMSGIPLRRAEELAAGRAVSADITGAGWRELGYPTMEIVAPADAGHRLARLNAGHDFTLFEYWKTDHAGHGQQREEAIRVLEVFDAMVAGVLEAFDPGDTLLLLTSDHGNIEDLSTRSHTRNPVPLFVCGHRRDEFLRRLEVPGRRPPPLSRMAPVVVEMIAELSDHPLRR
jgi:2,3-bisphosphoglycerate-independent phosphoglycerate mutase